MERISYYVLNIGLAAALLVIAQAFQTPFPALALVVLSKWRIIAVRPRFWWANIQANLVDLTVGIGVVGLMYLPTSVVLFPRSIGNTICNLAGCD